MANREAVPGFTGLGTGLPDLDIPICLRLHDNTQGKRADFSIILLNAGAGLSQRNMVQSPMHPPYAWWINPCIGGCSRTGKNGGNITNGKPFS